MPKCLTAARAPARARTPATAGSDRLPRTVLARAVLARAVLVQAGGLAVGPVTRRCLPVYS